MMPLFAFALPGVAFFTSAGGMAAVTSTMAALGLADAGSRATRRTQRTCRWVHCTLPFTLHLAFCIHPCIVAIESVAAVCVCVPLNVDQSSESSTHELSKNSTHKTVSK